MGSLVDEIKKADAVEVSETAVESPKEEVQVPKNVINLDMQASARTKIWVNGDNQRVLELNLSDMGTIVRFNEVYPKLTALQDEIAEMMNETPPEDATDDQFSKLAENFKAVDKKMREYVDHIFDFPVCDVCCDGGSMYDLVGGQYRFEYIIEKLSKLYDDRFSFEHKKLQSRIKSHTAKYTKKRTTRK